MQPALLCLCVFTHVVSALNATSLLFNSTATSFVPTALRAVLNTGPPPPSGAYGTAVWAGQSTAVRFTAPPDVPGYGATLAEVQLTIAANRYSPSNLRLSVVQDSGRNSPGTTVLESRVIRVPAYDGRVTITASHPGNLYLYPGELFWVTLEGDARYVQDAVSWLDSPNGVAWTAFNAQSVGLKEAGEDTQTLMGRKNSMDTVAGWIVERTTRASSIRVLVA
ncbi:hypothetical protein CcCBS67573_g07533 [Chytriomyces confervae]|uniref:Uncharacterized protein n=1 Tax=Chytriomyces confervae TaxID=246404 RepID=A0A507EVD8_9FUNG|nr:hypothetical protein CcCBS67573_g07533 [Chytriomyces confervae]